MKIHGVKSSQEKDDFDELYGDIDSSDITFYEVDINNFDFSDESLDSLTFLRLKEENNQTNDNIYISSL